MCLTKPLVALVGDGWRLHGEYVLPDLIGGGTIRIRLDQTTEDVTTGFNREELLRPIPPGDPDHDRLMARRNDSSPATDCWMTRCFASRPTQSAGDGSY